MNSCYPAPHRYSGPLYKNCRIGILGGSFDPAHAAHVEISLSAIKQYKLHAVWWLVSPQNPLKFRQATRLEKRIENARELVRPYPRIIVSDLETQLGTQFTFDTVKKLKLFFPATRFLFLIGSDNYPQLRRWDHWRQLTRLIPFAVFPRRTNPAWHPAHDFLSPTAQIMRRARTRDPFQIKTPRNAPAISLGRMRQNPLSSTELRRRALFPPTAL